ncbi:MAG TPA: hypothetical protein VIC33_04185 [Vicinamibacterales bacterium]|jgi:hypothetical protein
MPERPEVETIARACQTRRGRLKPLLLDQRFLAGIGNICSDEILYASGLHPLSRLEALDSEQRLVYRRATCPRGHAVARLKLNGRTAYFCPVEQRLAEKGHEGEGGHQAPADVSPPECVRRSSTRPAGRAHVPTPSRGSTQIWSTSQTAITATNVKISMWSVSHDRAPAVSSASSGGSHAP